MTVGQLVDALLEFDRDVRVTVYDTQRGDDEEPVIREVVAAGAPWAFSLSLGPGV